MIILIPNVLFLLFIAVRFNRARLKLRATSSPIYLAFYGLVICSVVISVIRCVVSMTVNAATNAGGNTDKVLWVAVRFFLLSTEMSVVIFGLAFGKGFLNCSIGLSHFIFYLKINHFINFKQFEILNSLSIVFRSPRQSLKHT